MAAPLCRNPRAVDARAGKRYNFKLIAAVAQLVERNLAKVEVESSRLFCRSSFAGEIGIRFPPFRVKAPGVILTMSARAGWQSGYAAACKAVYAGSIPTPASNLCGQLTPTP